MKLLDYSSEPREDGWSGPRERPMRTMKKLLKNAAFVLLSTAATILLLEAILRPFAYFRFGRSEYYLYYGIHSLVGRVGINPRSTFQGEYYKFPPHYLLKGAAGQESETASTNALGFRGRDFSPVKPAGVFRVVCLGESSTFGYRNRDDETYPVYLQQLLDRDGVRGEVINAGFPYYNSASILSLLKNEILTYSPDLITLYAGYNDTSWPTEIGRMGKLALWVDTHSITYLLWRRDVMSRFADKIERRVYGRAIPQKLRDEAFKKNDELVARRYRANVQSISELARSRGIAVVLIKQPVTARNPGYESMSYEEENRRVKEKFERGEMLSDIETWMLKQHHLMLELDKIANEKGLPVVDNIRIVDQDRRRLASWVHLTAEGNQKLAEALVGVVETQMHRNPAAASTAHPSNGNRRIGGVPATVASDRRLRSLR
jgi:lysophospholipase L1-like esterase